MLREFEAQAKRPGIEVHNAVVNVCCECGYMEQAFDLFYRMEVLDLPPASLLAHMRRTGRHDHSDRPDKGRTR